MLMNNSPPTVSAITTHCDMVATPYMRKYTNTHAHTLTPASAHQNLPSQAAYVLFIKPKIDI